VLAAFWIASHHRAALRADPLARNDGINALYLPNIVAF
jgi:hypothetical protein